MSTRITVEATASFVHLFEPKAVVAGQDPKYSVQLVFDPGYDYGNIQQAINEAIADKWGANPPPNLKLPVVDPLLNPKFQPLPFYQGGKYYINANSKDRVDMLFRNGQEIMNAKDLYSGCRVAASVSFFGYNTAGNQGVGVGLNAVVKLADGERLDNRVSAAVALAEYIDPNADIGQTPPGHAPAQQQVAQQQAVPQQAVPQQQVVPGQPAPQQGYAPPPGQPAPQQQVVPGQVVPQQQVQQQAPVDPNYQPINPATGQPY